MDRIVQFAQSNPVGAAVLAAVVLAGLYLLLNYKPKVTREADERFRQLRDGGRDRYNQLRPPN
jgi:hypothetical protein